MGSIRARPQLLWNLFRSGRLTIRARLTACFVAIILLMLAASLVAGWQFRRMTAAGERLNRADQLSLAVVDVHLDVNTLRNRLAALADTQDGPEFAKEASSLRRKFLDDVTRAQQLFAASCATEHDPVILSMLQTVQVTLPSQIDSVMGLAALNDWPAVHQRLTDQVQGLMDLSSLLVERVDREVSQQRAEAIESAQRASRQLMLVLPVTALFTMLMAVVLGWHVTQTITEPLSQLYAGAQALARGEFQHEVKVTGEDELAALANAFNYAARRLLELYQGLRDSEEALRRSEVYLAEAQKLTRTGSWASNLKSQRLVYCSEEMFQIFGLDPAKEWATGESFWKRLVPEDNERVHAVVVKAFHEKADFTEEYRMVQPDGAVKYIQTTGHPVLDSNGEVLEYVGTVMDVTERKRAEGERERLHQIEADLAHINRVSMLGELAASLAHELKQPLTAVMTNAKTCSRWLARDEPDVAEARAAAQWIVDDATRAAEIIDRLRAFYRKGISVERELVNVNEVLAEMLDLLRSEAYRYSISMRTDFAGDLPKIRADRVQLQQVLLNLMLNGIEAMKGAPGELTIKSELRRDGQLLISVIDAGVGLPPGKADQIFNAFFTTKPQGSGMGLAISRSIVESHGGHLWATPNSGRGTTFQFTLSTRVQEAKVPLGET